MLKQIAQDDIDVLNEKEIFEIIDFIINDATLNGQQKQVILKQLFANKPLLLDKILKNHPAFREFHTPKEVTNFEMPNEKLPIIAPKNQIASSRKSPGVDIKAALQSQKEVTNNFNQLTQHLKTCLKHEIMIDFLLIKNLLKLQSKTERTILTNTVTVDPKHNTHHAKEKALETSQIDKKKTQEKHNLEKLYMSLQQLFINDSDRIHQQMQIAEAQSYQESVANERAQQGEKITLFILKKISEIMKASTIHSAPRSTVAELISHAFTSNLNLAPDSEEKLEDFLSEHQDQVTIEEDNVLKNQEIPLEIRLTYLILIAQCINDKHLKRPDTAVTLLDILLNPKNLSNDGRNQMASNFCALLLAEKAYEPFQLYCSTNFKKGP